MDSPAKPDARTEVPDAPGAGSRRPEEKTRPVPDEGVGAAGARAPRLGRLLERTAQPISAVDLDGRITYANRAFEELLGYSQAELLELTIRDITPPRWLSTSAENLSAIEASGRSARYEKEYLRKDGRVVPVEVAVDPDVDDQGNSVGFYAFITDVSERKRVECALRESEDRFRRIFDDAPVGYYKLDAEGRILNINRPACELLGRSREELVGKSLLELLGEPSRAGGSRRFLETYHGLESVGTFERAITAGDGRYAVVSCKERLCRDEQGELCAVLGSLQDVTEQKRTEAALVASERRARALFEGMHDPLIVHSPEGRILDINPAACRLLGYSREELLGMSTGDIDAPEFASGYRDRLEVQLRFGHLAFEGAHRTKLGRIVPVDINSATIVFDDEKAILSVIRDITERKALEETKRRLAEEQERSAQEVASKNRALTASEARYRLLTEGCLDAVIVADRQGRITLFNPAAETTFGYTSEEIVGRPISVLMPKEFGENVLDDVFGRRQSAIVGRTVELLGRRKSGEDFPLELSLSATELAGELQFIGSIRDQTERQRMRAMLAQSEKLASIGLLSAGVAHEINNPLAYVANNLVVLEREMTGITNIVAAYEAGKDALATSAPDVLQRVEVLAEELDWEYVRENIPKILGRTREGVQRVANIVQNLRGLARTSPPKMEPVAIHDLVESAVEMMRGRLRRHNIELEIDHGETPRLVCVASQISQVLLNLLINACQAIEAQGKDDGGSIRFHSTREGEMAILSVTDNGCGIPAEELPHLFDPFYTTKPVGEGTGLGLSISHGIITGHGGRIEVESRPGLGTSFRIYLPLKSA
ncbi:PAS domain-containing sensor histidine kinase [Singulisphaera rosea]